MKAENLARMRELLEVAPPKQPDKPATTTADELLTTPCPCCGSAMHIIERFEAGRQPHHRASSPHSAIRIDTS